MRIAIVVVIAIAAGAVFGALIARSQLAPQLQQALSDRDIASREHERLASELAFASERLQWLGVENEALRDQVAALQQTGGLPSQPKAAAGAPASGGQTVPGGGGSGSGTETGVMQSAAQAGAAPGNAPLSVEEGTEAMYEVKRQHVGDFLLEQVDQSQDPYERERIASLHARQQQVRDLYRELQNAKTTEEQERLLTEVHRARTDMKNLVEDQRNDLLRRSLEQAGVSDSVQQRQIIDSVTTLQQNPYWTEPMLMWGVAAQDR